MEAKKSRLATASGRALDANPLNKVRPRLGQGRGRLALVFCLLRTPEWGVSSPKVPSSKATLLNNEAYCARCVTVKSRDVRDYPDVAVHILMPATEAVVRTIYPTAHWAFRKRTPAQTPPRRPPTAPAAPR